MKTQKYENGVQTIDPKGNCPPVRFRIWLTVRVRIRVAAIFLGGREIVPESTKMLFFKENDMFEERQF